MALVKKWKKWKEKRNTKINEMKNKWEEKRKKKGGIQVENP